MLNLSTPAALELSESTDARDLLKWDPSCFRLISLKLGIAFDNFSFKLNIKCFHSLFVLYHNTQKLSHNSGPYIIQYLWMKNKRFSWPKGFCGLWRKTKWKVQGYSEIASIKIDERMKQQLLWTNHQAMHFRSTEKQCLDWHGKLLISTVDGYLCVSVSVNCHSFLFF
mgnify:CR=1 FL=1